MQAKTSGAPSGKVFLTGGGPGDPGLLTLRAQAVLRAADVLLYDALVSGAIVSMAPDRCEKIFVGKRGGDHAMPQTEIEALMVRKAREGKRVVRLKGGDPFVFGRGAEEAQTLHEAGIAFEIVPGITSAIAAAAYAGIPITHRDCNTSFTVVTGHEDAAKTQSTIDWNRLADPHQTVVLLMAMGSLREIARRLMDNGLPPSHPVAIVENGTRPEQRTATGTLATIADEARRQGLQAPAVIICGEVVRLREQIAWFDRSPLFGKRVLVTRPAHQSAEFAASLWAAGARPVLAPTIEIAPPDDPAAAERAVHAASNYAWLVFTSANGVRAFFDIMTARREDARLLGNVKVAAIGLATAAALRTYCIYPDIVPHAYVAENLAQALVTSTKPGDRVLVFRAAQARDVLPQTLREAGRKVDVVAAYATHYVNDPQLAQTVSDCDIVTFTSASTVAGFVHNLGAGAGDAVANKIVACIGPVTAQAARDAGLHVDAVADEYTAAGLLAALECTLPSR